AIPPRPGSLQIIGALYQTPLPRRLPEAPQAKLLERQHLFYNSEDGLYGLFSSAIKIFASRVCNRQAIAFTGEGTSARHSTSLYSDRSLLSFLPGLSPFCSLIVLYSYG